MAALELCEVVAAAGLLAHGGVADQLAPADQVTVLHLDEVVEVDHLVER